MSITIHNQQKNQYATQAGAIQVKRIKEQMEAEVSSQTRNVANPLARVAEVFVDKSKGKPIAQSLNLISEKVHEVEGKSVNRPKRKGRT